MSPDELKKKKDEQRAANKAVATNLARHHEALAEHYRQKADSYDEIVLVSP